MMFTSFGAMSFVAGSWMTYYMCGQKRSFSGEAEVNEFSEHPNAYVYAATCFLFSYSWETFFLNDFFTRFLMFFGCACEEVQA